MTGALHGWTERRSGRDREEMVTEGGKERKEGRKRETTQMRVRRQKTQKQRAHSQGTLHIFARTQTGNYYLSS